MRRVWITAAMVLLLGTAGIWGCSGEQAPDEKKQEKGAIREMTDQAAHEMVDHMQRPINRAEDAKGLVEGQQTKTYQDQ